MVEIICSDEIFNYAFYLYKDGVRISVQWYSKAKKAKFILSSSGVYKVVGFIKCGEDIVIKETKPFEYEHNGFHREPVSISIFGSCTSRDIFEYGDRGRFTLGAYVARQSVVSALSKPIDIDENELKLNSMFQKKQVINDFQKNTFEALKLANSKYLIIDLIDERFALAYFGESVVTVSNELIMSGIFDKRFKKTKISKIKNWKIFKKKKGLKGYSFIFNGKLLEEYIEEFCRDIKEVFCEENIIIHRAVMVNKYINKEGKIVHFPNYYLWYNRVINEKLNYMYDYFEKFLPKAFVINECENFYADENHKWGLGPMHYQQEYYEKVLEVIKQKIK